MNSRSRPYDGSRRYATSPPIEEELETGEPIPEEEGIQVVKPIPRARVVQDGRRDEQDRSDRGDQSGQTATDSSGQGRMVLSSAKYLQKNKDPEIERENRKKRQSEAEARKGDGGPLALEKGIFNGGVAGGLLAMIVAFLWFFVGLVFLDVFFIYPPILFVLGLAAFFKGLMKGK